MVTITTHTAPFEPHVLTALDRLILECFNPDPSFGLADDIEFEWNGRLPCRVGDEAGGST